MATWDQLTPYMDQATGDRRYTATRLLILLHIVGFALGAALVSFNVVYVNPLALREQDAVDRGFVWQFLTYGLTYGANYGDALMHFAGGMILWFVVMMIMLHQFGTDLEAMIGPRRVLAIFFAAQVYGGLAQCVYQLISGMTVPATGILYPGAQAILVASALMQPNRMILFCWVVPMRLITATLIFLGITCFSAIIFFRVGQAPVATVGAAAAAYFMFKLEPKLDRWLDRREAALLRRQAERLAEIRWRVDELLEKISKSGMESLTPEERAFLERASRKVGSER